MIDIVIKGYSFDELSKESKEKAINDHIQFWMDTRRYDKEHKGNYEKAIDEAEKMMTPWFTPSYIHEYCLEELLEEIRINEYIFDYQGYILPRRYIYNID